MQRKSEKSAGSSMTIAQCKDNVRFTLSDEGGVLKFKSFDIVDTPACAGLAEELRKYLLGRPLPEIDMRIVRSMRCPNDDGLCHDVIARIIEENVDFFS